MRPICSRAANLAAWDGQKQCMLVSYKPLAFSALFCIFAAHILPRWHCCCFGVLAKCCAPPRRQPQLSTMVEGPGATKNARNARKLVRCRLASIEGIDSVPVGARLAEVLCLGKEVWLIFASEAAAATGGDSDDVVDLCGGSDDDSVIDLCSDDAAEQKQEHAVRVHFGMSGSLKVDAKTPGYGARALRCSFDGGRTLEVFNVGDYGGVHAARDVAKVREKVFTRTSLDVCSEAFDPAAAAARLARETSKTVTYLCGIILWSHWAHHWSIIHRSPSPRWTTV